MLTGAEAMRGSGLRPAAKWAGLLGVVFALGSGEAAAQVLTPDSTFDGNGLKVDVAARVTEGASTTITVTVKASVAANTGARQIREMTVRRPWRLVFPRNPRSGR